MDKSIEEEDIQGLEKEIDAAVDRLFVEKMIRPEESSLAKSPIVSPPYGVEKKFEREKLSETPSTSPVLLKSIEKIESQLLSLEWEITKENIGKTRDEIVTLQKLSEGKPDLSIILNRMVEVLNFMSQNEEKILPPFIKFLLDSKETLKLLTREETEGEVNLYKKLVVEGMEARFSCLEGMRENRTTRPSLGFEGEGSKTEISIGLKRMEEIVKRMSLFSEKMDEILIKMDQHLLAHERTGKRYSWLPDEKRLVPVKVTLFRAGNKIFGVESDRVLKLYKIPATFYDKFIKLPKIRLKDFEVEMIHLNKAFPTMEEERRGEKQILALRGEGEYQGLIIDQVISKLSTPLARGGEEGGYLLGWIDWTYQNQPVEIPIIDLKNFKNQMF